MRPEATPTWSLLLTKAVCARRSTSLLALEKNPANLAALALARRNLVHEKGQVKEGRLLQQAWQIDPDNVDANFQFRDSV